MVGWFIGAWNMAAYHVTSNNEWHLLHIIITSPFFACDCYLFLSPLLHL
jgi:hypothetical protein